MLSFRDVQAVLIEKAVREARQQIPREMRMAEALNRIGAPTEPVGTNNSLNVLRADEQALDAPGVVLGE